MRSPRWALGSAPRPPAAHIRSKLAGVMAVVLLVIAAACSPRPITLVVFAAASLRAPFETLAAHFEHDNPGMVVTLQTGGSSTLATQIVNGAPVDIFAAAGPEPMATLFGAGLSTEVRDFAANTLTLITPADSPAKITTLEQLTAPGVRTVVCQPEVPCGDLTSQVLQAKGISITPASLEKDVTAVLTKVRLGEADAGFVYVTDARSAGREVQVVDDPVFAHHATRYPITVVRTAPQPDAANRFLDLVVSSQGRQVMSAAGFGAP